MKQYQYPLKKTILYEHGQLAVARLQLAGRMLQASTI
jgi:hypothetical protein